MDVWLNSKAIYFGPNSCRVKYPTCCLSQSSGRSSFLPRLFGKPLPSWESSGAAAGQEMGCKLAVMEAPITNGCDYTALDKRELDMKNTLDLTSVKSVWVFFFLLQLFGFFILSFCSLFWFGPESVGDLCVPVCSSDSG